MADTNPAVQELLEFHNNLETERKQYEPLWRDCATYIDPNADDFGAEAERRQGAKKGEKVFDNTAVLARDRLAAAHESMLVPRNAKWHGLKAKVEHLNDDEEVKEYNEAVTNRIFSARYRPTANFSSQIGAYFQQLDTFGTAAVFIDEDIGRGLRYKALHLNELYIAEDFQGRVNRVHRKFALTALQAMQMRERGIFSSLPEAIERAAKTAPLSRYWFVHCVYQNEDGYYGHGRNSFAYASKYLALEFGHLCAEGGYRTMPFAVGRYLTGPRETYGRSPGMTVLRTIQVLQEIGKTLIRQAQREADPPMFLSGQPGGQAFSMRAGAMNWGMIGQDGRELVKAFQSNANFEGLLAVMQDGRQQVNDAYLVTLFQVLLDKPPNMTATEALLRAQEKGVLLAPTMGRQQSEFLGPLIEREIDVLTAAGEFDDLPMPDVLLDYGAGLDIVYDAPLNRLQRTDEAVGLVRTIETLLPLADTHPEMLDVFDPLKTARVVADANGAPASALRTVDEMAALQKDKQERAAIDQTAQIAPLLGKAMKDMVQAQATAQSSPPTIPMVQPA